MGPERRTSAMAEEGGEGKAATRKNKREADQDADARAVSGNGVERAEGGEVGEGVTEEGRPKIRSTRKVQRHLAAERIRWEAAGHASPPCAPCTGCTYF